jgi:alpha-1,2-mannosyltransferase
VAASRDGRVATGTRPALTRFQKFLAWFAVSSPLRYVSALALVAVAAWASYWIGRALSSPHDQFDLKIYNAAVKFWTSGHPLYDYSQPDSLMDQLGFTYPPFSAVLMTPMTLLPWQAVQSITVIAIALSCAGFTYLLLQDSIRMRGPQGLLILGVATSAAFLFEPIRENISYGQVNIYLGLAIAFDFLFLARRLPKAFGIGVGLAAAVKLTPGIFILYLLVTRRWRAAIVASATFVVLSFGVAIVAYEEVRDFFTVILWDTSRVGHPDNVFNQSVNGFLARLASPDLPSRGLWAALAFVVVVFGMWRAWKLFQAGDDLAGVTVTGLVALMVTPISWTHHAVWVMPVMVILGHRAVELGRRLKELSKAERRSYWTVIGLIMLGIGWTIEAHHYVTDRTKDWSVATWSDQLLATLPTIWCLLVLVLLPARRVLPLWRTEAVVTTRRSRKTRAAS